MRIALSEAKTGISNYAETDKPPHFTRGIGYKGYHTTGCGKTQPGTITCWRTA
ncbi:MAG: hypothetical protein IPH20_18035 [Bacteroidales bacterium]|nr:hypothetical protein [Bacteroidales bacterium]